MSDEMVAEAVLEVAVHFIGRGWVRRTFHTEAAALRWLADHAGDYDEVRWAA